MENKIYGYIYLITNKINGKQYVGKTIRTIKVRFDNHCRNERQVISKAIKKYGKENFIVQELAITYNKKELKFLEELYISWFETLAPKGYNIMKISGGFEKHSEETKEKLSIINAEPIRLKANRKQGLRNRGKTSCKLKTSKYIGVHLKKNKYISAICYNGKRIPLGAYNKEIEAAKAYDLKALELFGYDCILNFSELREDYINGKIRIKRNKQEPKSGIKGIWFSNQCNKWFLKYFDKESLKERCKFFTTLEEAVEFKLVNLNN